MATDNPVLERMVPEMIENMIQIVVDHKLERKNYSTVHSVLPNKEKSRFRIFFKSAWYNLHTCTHMKCLIYKKSFSMRLSWLKTACHDF